jgi:hypothetical protein
MKTIEYNTTLYGCRVSKPRGTEMIIKDGRVSQPLIDVIIWGGFEIDKLQRFGWGVPHKV